MPQPPYCRSEVQLIESVDDRRGLALIAEGELGGAVSVDGLAERLGVGAWQLRRLFKQHVATVRWGYGRRD